MEHWWNLVCPWNSVTVSWVREMSPGPPLIVDSVMDKLSLYFRDGKSPSQVTEYLTRGMLMGQRAEPSDPAGWYLMTWESAATISRVSRVQAALCLYWHQHTHRWLAYAPLRKILPRRLRWCSVFMFFFCFFGTNVFVCHFRRLIDWNHPIQTSNDPPRHLWTRMGLT